MHLKYLSLCLFGFGLFGCSQHIVQNTNKNSALVNQRAIHGLNAIYETNSFDFKGQILIQNTPSKIKITSGPKVEKQKEQLDEGVKQRIDQVLKAQNIKLSTRDKNSVYEVLAAQSNPYDYLSSLGSGDDKSSKFISGLLNFLNNFEFSYDGSVHYRQKMAALNLNFQYEKPTLLVKSKVPMVIDLNQYKFYMNYFGLAPLFVNPEYQDSMAYLDFSKYKSIGEKIDFNELIVYAKQLNAVTYALADSKSVKNVAVSNDEKKNGTVEKIRLNTNIGELFLQNTIFGYINEPYISEKILGQKWKEESHSDEDLEDINEIEEISTQDIEDDVNNSQSDAELSTERVFTLIHQNLRGMNNQDNTDISVSSDEDVVASERLDLDHDEELETDNNVLITEKTCQDLLISKEKIPMGFVVLCSNNYDIDVLVSSDEQARKPDDEVIDRAVSKVAHVQDIFKSYQSKELTDVDAFKKIWAKHQPEIQAILKENSFFTIPIQIDVRLDQKGRAQEIVYDVVKSDLEYGKIHVRSTTQFLNYGQATSIDTSILKTAKSFKEMSKGSLLESIFSGVSSRIGIEDDNETEVQGHSNELKTSTDKMQKIALDTYKQTGSYLKTYQVIFALFYAAQKPEQFKYYSAQDINEIAELSAYQFSPQLTKPQGAYVKRLDKLAEKHQLIHTQNFDEIGRSVASFLDVSLESLKVEQYWNKLNQQHKTIQSAFASHYEKLFKDEYDFSSEDGPLLQQAAKIMSQSFVDDVNGKLSKKTIQNLKPDHEEFIDRAIYYKSYKDIMEHYKK